MMLAAAIVVAVSSCTKTVKNEPPTVTIISPTAAGGVYMSDSTVNLHIEFTDDDQLHELSVEIVREVDSLTVFHMHAHPDAATYSLNMDTVFTTAEPSNFVITATATDHDDAMTTDTESFHVHPM